MDTRLEALGITHTDWAATPESVRLVMLSLLDILQAQSRQITELQTVVRDLQARVGQTSRNSSKPPASDPPSAPPAAPRTPRGRKAGGQPGHDGHHRPLVPPDQVYETIDLHPAGCPHCQTVFPADLPTRGAPQRTQVWELPEIRPQITEYRQHACCCPTCQQWVTADLPPDAPPGAFGARATALMAVLRGRYRVSQDDVVAFLEDVCAFPISAASVVTSCDRVSAALEPLDTAIHDTVQAASMVWVDETSWPTETRKGWLWVAVCAVATSFRIHASRGRGALATLLTNLYHGVVHSDRYGVYRQFPNGQRQLCWAHLVRNLRGLADRYADERRWAQTLLAHTDDLFLLWHLYRGGWIDQVALQQALIPIRMDIHGLLQTGTTNPYPKLAAFSRDLLAQWDALWTFSRVRGVEPTNNAAERALRHAVLWRKGSFGSRSAAGCRFVERMLSVHATCLQQERSLFAVVTQAVQAAWAGTPVPVLIPTCTSGITLPERHATPA